jgi:hypothetical protein
MVIMVDGENKVVRLLGGGPIRCPLFRRGSILGDKRNTYRRVFIFVSFSGGVQLKSIVALNGEAAVRSTFRHVSAIHWACVARWQFVSSARDFGV